MMKRRMRQFDWSLFDSQPLVVRRVTWEHNVFPNFPVEPEAAKAVAWAMSEDARKVKADGAKA